MYPELYPSFIPVDLSIAALAQNHLAILRHDFPKFEDLLHYGEYVPGELGREDVVVGRDANGSNTTIQMRLGILKEIPQVWVDPNTDIDTAFLPEGIHLTQETPEQFIARLRSAGGYVVSFSGYASNNHNYEVEIAYMLNIITYIRTLHKRIALGLHGGTKNGIPAAANLLIATLPLQPGETEIIRVGCVPNVGLRSLGEVTPYIPSVHYLHMVGKEYGDEIESIAAPADLLICFGGGKNSVKEVAATKKAGGTAIVLKLQKNEKSATSIANYKDNIQFPGTGNIIEIEQGDFVGLYLAIQEVFSRPSRVGQ